MSARDTLPHQERSTLLACITSMVRMNFVVQYTVTLDSTWENVDIVIWSFVEQTTVVFCASLPALRQLLSPLANKVKSSSLPEGGITVTREVVVKHESKADHQDTNTGQEIWWH
ncbi:hypothetical protein ACKVWC_000207 [Pyricularia oryzae]